MTQAEEIVEQYEQEYQQITTSGQEQHVYIYDHPIMTTSQQPISSTGIHLKREITDKEQNGNLIDPSNPNVIVSETPTVYVELKNENLEAIRYPSSVRYDPPPERYHRHPGHYYPGHLPTHHQPQIHQREEVLKENEGQSLQHPQQQEIRIYEPGQLVQSPSQHIHNQQQQQISHAHPQTSTSGPQQQHQQQLHGEPNIQVETSDAKTQYTNLEPVTSHQNYYIASEPYQTSSNGNFTYLPGPPTSKEYIYHPSGSPVLYKSKKVFLENFE